MAGFKNITGFSVAGNSFARDINVVIAPQHIVNEKTYILPERRDPSPKNIRFKVEKPIQTFTGRETFLLDLHKVVKESQITVLTQAPFSVVAATGGLGKTETVRMYIQLHAHEYDHIIWIDAEENLPTKNQFIKLANRLGIATDIDGKQTEFELIRDQIFEKLLKNGNGVLLVFDNAEALEDNHDLNMNGIKYFLPKSLSPFFVEPTVIVTSRNQNWSLQKIIHLDLWTEGEGVVFVIQSLGLKNTSENNELAMQLGNQFGRLPIALQAAVAVILQQNKRNKNYGIQNLIDEYQNGSRRVFAQKPLDANMGPTRMSDTMLVLWNITFKKIVKFPDGELAIKILCFMAYLSPTRIPQNFVFALFEKDVYQDSFENALEILKDYSLIGSQFSADSDSLSLHIHRMIQDATIENLKTNEKIKSRTIFNEHTFLNETEVILKLSAESINYIKTLDTRVLLRGGEIVENLVQITNHMSKNLDVKEFRDLTVAVAGVLSSTNDFTKSIELYERVLKATPASEVESTVLENIRLKLYLATAYSNGGYGQNSIKLLKEVRKDQTRALGRNHSDTLETKGNIASALHDLGRYDEAAKKFSDVLQDFRNNQDTESEFFLVTQNNYAHLLLDQGNTQDALQLFTEALAEYEKNPDMNSKTLIRIKGNIAFILGEQENFEEASAMMLQTISDATQVFGPFHLHTFAFKRDYAQILLHKGKDEEAAQLLLELLEIQVTQLGSEHPDTLRTKDSLAVLYNHTLELDKALPLLDVEVRKKVFGLEHPQTMGAVHNLALIMMKQDKFVEAFSLHSKNLKLRKQVLGPNHSNTLNTMYNIGRVHYKLKEFDKAAEVAQEVLLRQEKVLGKNHPDTIKTLEFLTDCRQMLNEESDLIGNLNLLGSVDAEIWRSNLKASKWNTKVALDTFFNSNSTQDITGLEEQGRAFIPPNTTTYLYNRTFNVTSGKTMFGNQIRDLKEQVESVPKRKKQQCFSTQRINQLNKKKCIIT